MVILSSFIAAEYTHIAAAVVATYGVVRAWFAKEIAAGKVALAKLEADAKSVASKVETAVVTEVKKL